MNKGTENEIEWMYKSSKNYQVFEYFRLSSAVFMNETIRFLAFKQS